MISFTTSGNQKILRNLALGKNSICKISSLIVAHLTNNFPCQQDFKKGLTLPEKVEAAKMVYDTHT